MSFKGLLLVAMCTVCIAANVATCWAAEMTKEQRELDFNQLVSIVRSSYSMVGYKKEVLGVDIDTVEAAYRAKLAAVATDEQFYDLVQTFVTEFKDAHFSLMRPSSMAAALGFRLVRAEGKAIISSIDRKVLPEDQFPFAVGDELTALDGRKIDEVVKELCSAHSNSRPESNLGMATALVSRRPGVFGPVPTGPCRLTIRPRGETEEKTIAAQWIVVGKPLPGLSFFRGGAGSSLRVCDFIDSQKGTNNAAVAPVAASLPTAAVAPWYPAGGHAVNSKQFSACIVDSPKGPLGYVRISSFMPDESEEAAVKEFREILKAFWVTKGLVIDLVNNPGGSVSYVYSLASTLTDKPVELPLWSVRASRTTLNDYRQMLSDKSLTAQQHAALENRVDQIASCVQSGQAMTPFGYGWGIVAQAPDPEVQYTKPILVLINDQCYSGGDMFPSLLQDNKRAVLFGSNTAGAGGSVGSYGPLAYSGCTLSMTETIWKRQPTGTYIENVGAKPDVTYQFTADDVANGYKAYQKAYISTLCGLIE